VWYVKRNFWTHFRLLSPCAHMYICHYRLESMSFFQRGSGWSQFRFFPFPPVVPSLPLSLVIWEVLGQSLFRLLLYPLLSSFQSPVAKSTPLLWRRLHGARGGTCLPTFTDGWARGSTVSRKANKKLAELYWPSRKRLPKRLIVLSEPDRAGLVPSFHFRFIPALLHRLDRFAIFCWNL